MKNTTLLTAAALTLFRLPLIAQTIDFISGGGGTTTTVAQSFNETRTVDATVLSTSAVHVTGMTLRHLWSGADGVTLVGARIYDATTQALLCSHDTTVYAFANHDVTVPLACSLMPGQTYRIGFFCGGTASDNSALLYYMPTFPYNESNNLLQITAAQAYPADVYPTNVNYGVPVMSIKYSLATGISAADFSMDIASPFPNPFNDCLAVAGAYGEQSEVTVYDIASRKLIQQTFVSSAMLNTAQLSAGIYVYEVRNNQGIVKKGKLIKQ